MLHYGPPKQSFAACVKSVAVIADAAQNGAGLYQGNSKKWTFPHSENTPPASQKTLLPTQVSSLRCEVLRFTQSGDVACQRAPRGRVERASTTHFSVKSLAAELPMTPQRPPSKYAIYGANIPSAVIVP